MTTKPILLSQINAARQKQGLPKLKIKEDQTEPIKTKVSTPKKTKDESYEDKEYKPLGFINKGSFKAFSLPLISGLAVGGIATAAYGTGLLILVLLGAVCITGAIISAK